MYLEVHSKTVTEQRGGAVILDIFLSTYSHQVQQKVKCSVLLPVKSRVYIQYLALHLLTGRPCSKALRKLLINMWKNIKYTEKY